MEWISGVFAALAALFMSFFAYSLSYELPRPFAQEPTAVVLFGGDIMLDRSVREHMNQFGAEHPFSCISDTLRSVDVVVANLEGPITERESVSIGSVVGHPNNTRFTFATTTGELLKRQNIRIVSLGNNHMNDFGPEGTRSTMRSLERAGVAHFGDPLGHTVSFQKIGRVPLAFIAYNEFDPGLDGKWNGSASTSEQVRRAREAGYFPIVFPHWGDEYVQESEQQRGLARQFIEAGAELVVGAHPHIVQGNETYQGKHIYYSLGNLVFDQYWEEAVRRGLLLKVVFGDDGILSVEEIPTESKRDRTVCLLEWASSSLQESGVI